MEILHLKDLGIKCHQRSYGVNLVNDNFYFYFIGRNILMETDISLTKSPSTILDRKIDNLVDYFITSSM